MDFNEKKSDSSSTDGQTQEAISSPENMFGKVPRTCADCSTTKTPLWRGGPSGPRSLCNACGIRFRKRRRALLGLKNGVGKEKKESRKDKVGDSHELRLWCLEKDVLLQRSLPQKQRKLAEEEEAAVLLMALSYGLVNA